jgi:hypothetical protein
METAWAGRVATGCNAEFHQSIDCFRRAAAGFRKRFIKIDQRRLRSGRQSNAIVGAEDSLR